LVFARSDRQLKLHRLAVDLFQQAGDAAGVLGPHPVQFEAVGHEQRDPGEVVGDLRGQGFDPGVELLLGQFLGQLFDAGLPQAVAGAQAGVRHQAVVLPLTHVLCSPVD
jgi:hypothetical protein